MGQKQSVLALVHRLTAPPGFLSRILTRSSCRVCARCWRMNLRFQVVAEAYTLASCHKKIIAQRPQVAFLDWCLASKNLELTTALLQSVRATTAIIFLTASENSRRSGKCSS